MTKNNDEQIEKYINYFKIYRMSPGKKTYLNLNLIILVYKGTNKIGL